MAEASRKTLSLVHRVREPGVAPARSERAPLLVLFHGVGSNELAMAALAERFDGRFVVISARSPIELAPYAFGWFRVTFTIGGPVIDGDELQAAWTRATSFIDEAVAAYDADPTRVFVAGFSQGGIVALATLLTAPEKIAGAVCMSGRLPPEVLPHVVSLDRLRGKPVLIVHGTHDETLGITYGRSARQMLRPFPLRLEYREFEMGHTTSDESVATVAAWLTARLSP
jgi:phospholipase/carboxylesterase